MLGEKRIMTFFPPFFFQCFKEEFFILVSCRILNANDVCTISIQFSNAFEIEIFMLNSHIYFVFEISFCGFVSSCNSAPLDLLFVLKPQAEFEVCGFLIADVIKLAILQKTTLTKVPTIQVLLLGIKNCGT